MCIRDRLAIRSADDESREFWRRTLEDLEQKKVEIAVQLSKLAIAKRISDEQGIQVDPDSLEVELIFILCRLLFVEIAPLAQAPSRRTSQAGPSWKNAR